MRILSLTTSYPAHEQDYRGSFVADLSAALVERGHEVEVIHPGGAREDAEASTLRGVRVRGVGEASLRFLEHSPFQDMGVLHHLHNHPLHSPAVGAAIAQMAASVVLTSKKPDLILSHWLIPNGLLGSIAARRFSVPHLCVEHGGGARLAASTPFGSRIATQGFRKQDCIQFVSRDSRDKVLSKLPDRRRALLEDRSFVFPMPVAKPANVPEVHRQPTETLRVLVVARLVPEKGLVVALEALAAACGSTNGRGLGGRWEPGECRRQERRPEQPQFSLTIAGDGPQRPELEERARQLGVDSMVTFKGEVGRGDLASLYAAHDVLLVPSLATGRRAGEGVPLVLLEAMAHGLAVVASEVGGVPEVVRHGHNGLLVKAGDRSALGTQLTLLSSFPIELKTLGAKGMETAAAFGVEQLLERYRCYLPELRW